ncbi:MAG: branched-chain amino acid ABC transporter permease [Armatimonadota bacterium]
MSGVAQLLQFLLSGVTVGSIYALIAIGFTIIYNCTQVVNFAQGEFVMLGAMIAAALVSAGAPLWAACVAAVALASAVGLLVSASLIRPLRSGSTVTLVIITVGASILLRGSAALLWGKDARPVPAFSAGEGVRIAGASLPTQAFWVFLTTGCLVLLLWLFYRYTMLGRAMRACASCKPGARIVGINPSRMTLLAFTLGSAIGAVAGVVMAPITFAQHDMGTMLGLKGFCAAVLGGMGSFGGCVVAGVCLGVLEAMGAGLVSSAYKDAIAFVILLTMLLARPQGFLGGRSRD